MIRNNIINLFTDCKTFSSNRLFHDSTGKFVSCQLYTNHECKIREICVTGKQNNYVKIKQHQHKRTLLVIARQATCFLNNSLFLGLQKKSISTNSANIGIQCAIRNCSGRRVKPSISGHSFGRNFR